MRARRIVAAALAAAASVAWAYAATQAAGAAVEAVDAGPTYRPEIQPLGWSTDGRHVLFVHTEVRGGYDYHDISPCGTSGIYRTDGGSAPAPVLVGRGWCRASTSEIVRPSLSADGRTVFVLPEHGYDDCTPIGALKLDTRRWRRAGRVCGSYVYVPALSPDGGRIALDLGCGSIHGGGEPSRVTPRGCVDRDGGRLTVMNPDGSARRLVGEPGDKEPVWSPDGLALAVRPTGGRNDGDHIAIIDLRTGGRRMIAHGTSPVWSRDGQWLAFTRHPGREGGRVTLHVIRTDGTGERLVFTQQREDMHGPQYPSPGGWPRDPMWSPDGRRIVFTKHFQTGNTLWIVNADGTGLRLLSERIEPAG